VINTFGKFITAQPMGVHDGIDFQYTGTVRKVDAQAISGCLDTATLRSSRRWATPHREVFNLTLEDVAVATPRVARRETGVFSDAPVEDDKGELLSELTAQEAAELLARGNRLSADTRLYLAHAVEAVRGSVQRAHVITRRLPGALLIELFTHEGSGTMITADKVVSCARPRSTTRAVSSSDRAARGRRDARARGRELLEREIGCFSVIEHDGVIVGCAALYPFPGARAGELACLACVPITGTQLWRTPAAANRDTGTRPQAEKAVRAHERATHWFIERGFAEANITVLPREKKALYNYQRRSKILVKQT